MILVYVQQASDFGPARALIAAVAGRMEPFLLFSSSQLMAEYGRVVCAHGSDAKLCALNADSFELVVCFSALRDPRFLTELRLLSHFMEVGIPVVAIQTRLLQTGFEQNAPTRDELGLQPGLMASHRISWTGQDGIGYLESERPHERIAAAVGDDFVLITPFYDWPVAAGNHRYKLAIAVLQLATARPDLRFVWQARVDHELDASEAQRVSAMVHDYALPNVTVSREASTASLVAACRYGIATLSTALLSYQLQQKPALVYACPPAERPSGWLQASTFRDAAELKRRMAELESVPNAFQVQTGVAPLNEQQLEGRLRALMELRRLAPNWLSIAVRNVPEIGPAQSAETSQQLKKLAADLLLAIERIGVLHKSTLAYKAKKLVKGIGKG